MTTQVEAIKIQRAPVSHRCKCGRQDFLLFPDAAGCLTWRCSCKDQRQINFRPAENEEYCELEIEFRRAPMDHGCKCGRRDTIVLPKGRGELIWSCAGEVRDDDGVWHPCGKVLRMIFTETGGSVYDK